jgi:hypothetical protein
VPGIGDPGAFAAPVPEVMTEPSAQVGRPPYDWFRIAVEVCWHFSGQGNWAKLRNDKFIAKMQEWCKQELGEAPSADEIRRRLGIARKRFPRS